MTGHDLPPGAHSVLLGLASRHSRRRDAVKAAIRLLYNSTLSAQPKHRLSVLSGQLNDWAILGLAAIAGGILVCGAACILLLELPDLVQLPDASWPTAPATCGTGPAPEYPVTAPLSQPPVCSLKLSQARLD